MTDTDLNNIVAIFLPQVKAAKEGYLWAQYGIGGIEGVHSLFYCANAEIAYEVITNQIKPFIQRDEGYFVIFHFSDRSEINTTNPHLTTSFSVIHFGAYDTPKAQAIARTHTVQLLEMFWRTQRRYISNIVLGSSDFQKWSDDNSVLQQYTSYVSVNYVQSYLIGRPC